MDLDPDRHRLSPAALLTIFKRDIVPDVFADAKTSKSPITIIFGGQPGAGKSAAVSAAFKELQGRGGGAQIIGDDLRAYHPRYARLLSEDDKTAAFYTDRDTGLWVEMAIARARDMRVNAVIEGTMRNGDKVASTMRDFRIAGYSVDARALAVPARLSVQGIILRYEEQKLDRGYGRMTTQSAHDDAFTGMLSTVERIESEKLADHMTLMRRGGVTIYSNTLHADQWSRPTEARAALEAERRRPLSLEELDQYVKGFDRLMALKSRPGRGLVLADIADIANIKALRGAAFNEYAAEVFRQCPEDTACRLVPELRGALTLLAEQGRALAGMDDSQRATVLNRVRDNLATQIESGSYPHPRVADFSKGRDLSR